MITGPETVRLSKLGHKADSLLAKVKDWIEGLELVEFQLLAEDNSV